MEKKKRLIWNSNFWIINICWSLVGVLIVWHYFNDCFFCSHLSVMCLSHHHSQLKEIRTTITKSKITNFQPNIILRSGLNLSSCRLRWSGINSSKATAQRGIPSFCPWPRIHFSKAPQKMLFKSNPPHPKHAFYFHSNLNLLLYQKEVWKRWSCNPQYVEEKRLQTNCSVDLWRHIQRWPFTTTQLSRVSHKNE